jgi:hypothetical protein
MGTKKSGGLLRGKGGGLRVEGDLRRGSEEETLEVKVVLLGSQGKSRHRSGVSVRRTSKAETIKPVNCI